MPSPEFEKFYRGIQKRLALPAPAHQTIADVRKGFEDWVGANQADPDIAIEPFYLGSVPALRVAAPNVNRHRIILFFHAGSYNSGTSWSHRDLTGRLSRASNSVVIEVDYRLAPEHPFPAALEDALASYRLLLGASHPPKEIALVGISAGGGLALALMLLLKQKKEPLPRCVACMSPWVDLALTGTTLKTNDGKDLIRTARLVPSVDLYCAGHDPADPLVSPLYGDLSGFPPLYIQVGGREILLDEAERLAKLAKSQGVETKFEVWPDMVHGWHLFGRELPEGREAIQKIGDWI